MTYTTRYSVQRFVIAGMAVLATLFVAVLFAPERPEADSFNWNNLVVNGGTYSFVSPVRNQGAGGTCWAFAATGALEARYMITRNDPTFSMDLSEQMLVSAPAPATPCRAAPPRAGGQATHWITPSARGW